MLHKNGIIYKNQLELLLTWYIALIYYFTELKGNNELQYKSDWKKKTKKLF